MEEIILKNFEEFLKIVEDINVAKRYIIKFNKYFDFIGLTEQDIKLYALKLAWSFNKINLTNFLYNIELDRRLGNISTEIYNEYFNFRAINAVNPKVAKLLMHEVKIFIWKFVENDIIKALDRLEEMMLEKNGFDIHEYCKKFEIYTQIYLDSEFTKDGLLNILNFFNTNDLSIEITERLKEQLE